MIGSIVVHGARAIRSLDERRHHRPALSYGRESFSPNSAAPPAIAADTQGRGPNLQGVFGKPVLLEDGRTVTADENYVRESILDPGAKSSTDSSRSCRRSRDWSAKNK